MVSQTVMKKNPLVMRSQFDQKCKSILLLHKELKNDSIHFYRIAKYLTSGLGPSIPDLSSKGICFPKL